MKKKVLFGVVCLFVAVVMPILAIRTGQGAKAAPVLGEYDLVVAPDGNDQGAGTPDDPLRTIEGAKERLKSVKSSLPDERITVYIRGGRYELMDVLTFTEEDVGNVSFVSYDHEEVIISGAKAISGFNEESVNGVRVFTKTLTSGIDCTDFKSLFSDTETLIVPRYPESGYFIVNKLDPDNDLWTEETTQWDLTLGQRSFFADPNDLKTDFTNYSDVQVRILHYWHDELMYLTDFNRSTGRIGLSRPSSMRIRDIDRFYFENVFEALNEPGEWYLNRQTNKLYYVPKEGERADTLVLYASDNERLIDINGVDGLTFEGIRFTQTDWEIPDPKETDWDGEWRIEYDIDALQAAYDVRGVITTRYAKGIKFIGCEFVNLGACGIKMLHGTQDSCVENCLFRNIAATAVYAGSENCQPDDPECVKNITVKNCDISGYGRKFFCAIGIHITFCDGATLSHNEISDGYYTGISVGWIWGYDYHLTRNIKITDNLIYNIGQGWLSDMGGIYMLGMQPGTVISGNVIHNVAADPGEGGYGGWGIYLDEGSSRMLVENNLVFCCGSQSFNIHYGEGNIIRNNIGAFSAEGQVSVGSNDKESHATAFYYDNIFVSKNGEPIYVYMSNTSHFYENGNLLWDMSNPKPMFCTDKDKSLLSLFEAKAEGFIHNPTIADPLFVDIEHYDFTLKEESPAFALNFLPWDYGNAGTIKGTVIGFSLQGGQTPYNAYVSEVTTTQTFTYPWQRIVRNVLLILATALVLFWLVYAIVKSKGKRIFAFLVTLFALALGIVVYYFFVHWNVIVYVAAGVLMSLSLAAIATFVSHEKNDSVKRALTFGLMWFAIVAVLFFGTTFLLNNILHIGEKSTITVTLSLPFIILVVHTARFVKATAKKRIPRPRG